MDGILTDFSREALEHAMNLNLSASLFSLIKGISNAKVHNTPDIAWSITDVDFWFLNSTVPIQLEQRDMAKAATESRERANARGVQATWWVSPGAINHGLSEHLKAHGFVDIGGPPGMAIDLAKMKMNSEAPANMNIRLVENASTLGDWIEVLITGYPMPEYCRKPLSEGLLSFGLGADRKMRLYLGYLNDRPVTASLVTLAGGVAGIYCVATLEGARRKGLGSQITFAPLLQVRDEGYRIGVLQASEMGRGVYSRIGFKDIFQYKLFMLPDPQTNL